MHMHACLFSETMNSCIGARADYLGEFDFGIDFFQQMLAKGPSSSNTHTVLEEFRVALAIPISRPKSSTNVLHVMKSDGIAHKQL